jgi:DNA-directed RNA polymerase subunit RPC12/RpoP
MLYCIYEEAMKEIERYGNQVTYGNQLTSDVQDCSSDNIVDSINEDRSSDNAIIEDCSSDNIEDSINEDRSSDNAIIEDFSSDNIIDMVVDNIVDSIVQDFSSDGVLQEKKVSSKKKHHCSYCDYNILIKSQHRNKKNFVF